MATRLKSFAKINLGLTIGPTRPDGFHGLVTMYQTIAAHDWITVHAEPASTHSIEIVCDHPQVPKDSSNTCWKMAAAVLESLDARLRLKLKIRIEIEKLLPVQGGLGAGSANAAATLLALEQELHRLSAQSSRNFENQNLEAGRPLLTSADKLLLAERIGSDVPLFLLGGTVLGLGRGERVIPLPDLPQTHCVLAIPSVSVSTPQAFRDWDSRDAPETASSDAPGLTAPGLTPPASFDRLEMSSRVLSAAWLGSVSSGVFSVGEGLAGNPLLALVRTGIVNDFESVVFSQQPMLLDLKRVLAAPASASSSAAALYSALSGSGSALFGLYASQLDAESAAERVREFGLENGAQALLTKTLGRDEYWQAMSS